MKALMKKFAEEVDGFHILSYAVQKHQLELKQIDQKLECITLFKSDKGPIKISYSMLQYFVFKCLILRGF